MCICSGTHILRKRAGVGKYQTVHYFRIKGGDDLRHNTAKRLPYKPGFLAKVLQQRSHGLCKLLVVGKADGVIKSKDREIFGQSVKMQIEQIGQTDSASQENNGRFCLRIFIVAVGKGFSAG